LVDRQVNGRMCAFAGVIAPYSISVT
jgi:hypothetical protein